MECCHCRERELMLRETRLHTAAANGTEVHGDHEGSDRVRPQGEAQRHARPRHHQRRRPADVAQGEDAGQAFYSVLYSESKKPDGLVVQVDRGMFKLNPKRKAAKPEARS
jgi:hypothetical protein